MTAIETVAPRSADVAARVRDVRSRTDRLAAPLSPEDQTAQSMPDASPTKWHLAHTTWFFEEFVLAAVDGYRVFDPAYRYLFNSYYDAVGPRHPRHARGLITRPGVREIADYRQHVDRALATVTGERALVELGCQHEQQHQELLLMDVKHLLSLNRADPVYVERPADPDLPATAQSWLAVGGGRVEIGYDGAGFAFDNEGPRHVVHLDLFEIAARPVTNADWLDFVADGGYRRAELWLSDGWDRVHTEEWRAPLYWRDDLDGWTTFTLSGRRPVRPCEPVCHVSYYEADAYARWAGARLPTEQEWESAAGTVLSGRSPSPGPERFHPGPVRAATVGDVWEWTSSAYLPYPGFRPSGGALGEYNGKFMCDRHVLRGASAVTPFGHERTTYRNFFPAGARWAFSGVRLAR